VGTHDAPQCRQPINRRGIHVSEKKHLVSTPQTWMSVGQHISDSEVDLCVCACVRVCAFEWMHRVHICINVQERRSLSK
jgi:hypothetical protein